jgi:hypothetical protein
MSTFFCAELLNCCIAATFVLVPKLRFICIRFNSDTFSTERSPNYDTIFHRVYPITLECANNAGIVQK